MVIPAVLAARKGGDDRLGIHFNVVISVPHDFVVRPSMAGFRSFRSDVVMRNVMEPKTKLFLEFRMTKT